MNVVWGSRVGKALGSLAVGFAALTLVMCSSNEGEPVGQHVQALSTEQARILGFEAPTTDWTASGGQITESSNVSQGSAALAVSSNGYVVVASDEISGFEDEPSEMTVDLLLPQQLQWGTLEFRVHAPSLNAYSLSAGPAVNLSSFQPGEYRTIHFPVSSAAAAVLAGSATDMRLELVLNAPASSTPYLLDNLSFGDESSDPSVLPLTLTFPLGDSLNSAFVSASDQLRIEDSIQLGVASDSGSVVSSLGSGGVEFGADTSIYSTVKSKGDVDFSVLERMSMAMS